MPPPSNALDLTRLDLARRALAEASRSTGLVTQSPYTAPTHVVTGIASLDQVLGGGLPRGRLIELTGRRSSGRMALTLRLLGAAMRGGEPVALVDVADALDPSDLNADARTRVLWVRPATVLAGLKSVDVILDAGGFAMVALYLVGVGARERVPTSAWTRLVQRAEHARTALLTVTDAGRGTSPGSFAAVTLDARRQRTVWSTPSLLDAVEGEVTVVRNRQGHANVTASLKPDAETG